MYWLLVKMGEYKSVYGEIQPFETAPTPIVGILPSPHLVKPLDCLYEKLNYSSPHKFEDMYMHIPLSTLPIHASRLLVLVSYEI